MFAGIWGNINNLTPFRQQQTKKIIFVFVITTLISSLSAAAFVTSNMNLALAKKSSSSDNGGSGGGNKDKGSGSSGGGDNGGGSGDNGGSGGGSDNTGGGGSDNNNGGTTSDNTAAPSPPTTDETTQTPPTAENQQTNTCPDGSTPDPTTGKCPTPPDNSGGTGSTPPPTNQQTNTCPDGSAPDSTSGTCPTSSSQTLAPNQPPAAQDGGHILVMPNPDGTCPVGSHKFPGSQVCEKDTVTPPSSSGGRQVPPECQGIIAGPSDKCSLGTTGSPTSPINAPPLTPQQQYEQCLRGIGGGIPGNCKPPTPTTTEQNVAPLQTLTPQQTCKDGSTPNANGICQDGSTPQQTCKGGEVLTDKGNCVSSGESQAIKNGTLVDIGNGKFELGTRPPVPNTNTIAPICPSDSHLVGSKCVVNGAGCPPGTVQDDGDITCSPFKQVEVPVNPDGICPEGAYSVGSSGNAGQPGTGSIFCFKNVPIETPPPAGSPSNTPPTQPSQPKQLVPTETLTQKTCPPLPIDANGNCPGVDMRGGGLGLPPTPTPPPVTPVEIPANPDGTCTGVFDPPTNKCYHDNFHAPHCPGKPAERNNIGIERSALGFCDDPQTGLPVPVLADNADGTCEGSGVHIAARHGACFVDSSFVSDSDFRNIDGSCKTGYISTGNKCSLRIHDPLPDGSCPAGYRKIAAPTAPVPGGIMCKNNLDNNPDRATNELPGGYCPAGYKHVSLFSARYCQLE